MPKKTKRVKGKPKKAKAKRQQEHKVKRQSMPVALGAMVQGSKPLINGGKATVITHKEFVGDFVGSASFSKIDHRINPADPDTFPWLSSIAVSYEQYRFKRLVFTYETLVGTQTAGSVLLASEYDVMDPPFTDKISMASQPNYIKTPSYLHAKHDVLLGTADYMKKYFVARTVPAGTDPRLYDVARTTLATVGTPADVTIGELYVEYTVELYNPQLPASVAPAATSELVASATGNVHSADVFSNYAAEWTVLVQSGPNLIFGEVTVDPITMYLLPAPSVSFCINLWGYSSGASPSLTIALIDCMWVAESDVYAYSTSSASHLRWLTASGPTPMVGVVSSLTPVVTTANAKVVISSLPPPEIGAERYNFKDSLFTPQGMKFLKKKFPELEMLPVGKHYRVVSPWADDRKERSLSSPHTRRR